MSYYCTIVCLFLSTVIVICHILDNIFTDRYNGHKLVVVVYLFLVPPTFQRLSPIPVRSESRTVGLMVTCSVVFSIDRVVAAEIQDLVVLVRILPNAGHVTISGCTVVVARQQQRSIRMTYS